MDKKPATHLLGGGSAVGNFVNLNKCLFCNSVCHGIQRLSSLSSSSGSHGNKEMMNTVAFLVRILLEIPQDELQDQQLNFSDDLSVRSSSVSSWLRICKQCTKAVRQAQQIYSEIVNATNRFRRVQTELVNKVKELPEAANQHDMLRGGDNGTADKCRQFAKEHHYEDYPFSVHDAESLRKLGPTETDDEQFEFTDVFPVKVEPEAAHEQFILPDDFVDQSENVEVPVSELLSASAESTTSSQQIGISDKTGRRCIPCNRVFNSRSTLYNHRIKNHTGEDPKKACEFCGKFLANEITYRRHKRERCPKNPNRVVKVKKKSVKKPVKNGKKYWCVPCNAVFNGRHTLYNHRVKNHKGENPTKACEFCGKVLANLITYRRHKKICGENKEGKDKSKRIAKETVKVNNELGEDEDGYVINLELGLD